MTDLGEANMSQNGHGYFTEENSINILETTPETAEENTNPRDNKLRSLVQPAINRIVETASDTFPNVTANHLTIAGAVAVTASAALVIAMPDRPVLATTIFAVGSGVDGFDGHWARLGHKRNGTKPSIKGELLDVTADKIQQVAVCAALSVVARRRGNNVAANNYAAAAITAAVPALLRSKAEKKGLVVGENGLGTRVTSAVISGAGMALNKNSLASNVASSLLVAGSAITSSGRADVLLHGDESKHLAGTNTDRDFKHNAAIREERLEKIVKGGVIVGASALAYRPKQLIS